MDKDVTVNQKKGNSKQPKIKKKQPLKVVYITNPIRFKASASEFRSLVQELTGQDSDLPESSTMFAADGCAGGSGGGQPGNAHEAAKMGLDEGRNTTVHALGDETKIGQHIDTIHGDASQGSDPAPFWSFDAVPQGPDPSPFGSFGGEFYSPQMVEEFQGLVDSNLSQEASHFDVFKRLDSM